MVYLVISRAFDNVSHLGILNKLSLMGVKGRLLRWLKDFHSNRTFQVSVLGELSSSRDICRGVPQGAILSPTLFNVLMADFPQVEGVKTSIFADDVCLFVMSDKFDVAVRMMQDALNGVGIGHRVGE